MSILTRTGLFVALLLAALPARAADQFLDTEAGQVRVETFASGLDHPWGLAMLPDGRMLVTERPGRMRIVAADGTLSAPLTGVPRVFAEGQGGLLDVALSPSFATDGLIYFCYAKPGPGGASTAAARAKLGTDGLEDVKVIYRQQPLVDGRNHFGCRIAFRADGTLFITQGERFKFYPAQDLGSDLGKVVRINPDGSIPHDNPFVGTEGARPEIWSYGHRNVQGAAIHPETGALWISEFGPQGGDEINIPEAGRNYGWPLVSWGEHYDGRKIPDPTTRPDLAQPIWHWTPSVSPSGITFYTGALFPQWRGNLLVGGLSSESLIRLVLDGAQVKSEERILMEERIRNVRQGNDGAVYLLIDDDDGAILRLTPG